MTTTKTPWCALVLSFDSTVGLFRNTREYCSSTLRCRSPTHHNSHWHYRIALVCGRRSLLPLFRSILRRGRSTPTGYNKDRTVLLLTSSNLHWLYTVPDLLHQCPRSYCLSRTEVQQRRSLQQATRSQPKQWRRRTTY